MTKTDKWENIKILKPKFFKNKTKYQKECTAWDSETSEGACGLLANSQQKVLESHDADEIFDFLGDKEYQKQVNVFYNLGYDTNAVIKLLPQSCIEEIAKKNETSFDGKQIRIIPNKFLKVGRNRFFDVWQFFKYEGDSRLDSVAKKYLGKEKIDVEGITGIKKENYQFQDFKNPEIQKYCIQDCIITKELTDMIIEKSNQAGIFFNSPYSCATLSKNFFFDTQEIQNPKYYYTSQSKYGNIKAFEMGFYSYNGGRFEVFKKGTYNNIYEYDVNSMYPTQIKNLPDIFCFDFVKCVNEQAFDRMRQRDTIYAFAEIEVNQDMKINILPFKDSYGVLVYPKGKIRRHVTFPEIELLEKYEQEYKIIHGIIGEANKKIQYPFKEPLEKIYTERKKYDKSNFISSLYKIIMNSLYGSFIEININLSSSNGDIENMIADDSSEQLLCKSFEAGKYFCPVYASYITANARCMLTDTMLQNDYENIIACFTDSIISDAPLKNIDIGKELGTWELTKYDEINIVGTGLYHMVGEKEKSRTRGFRFMGIDEFDFKKFLGNEYEMKHATKLKESIKQKNLEDFNKIIKIKKEVDLNFDKKRNWYGRFESVDDVYNKQIKSEAITLDG